MKAEVFILVLVLSVPARTKLQLPVESPLATNRGPLQNPLTMNRGPLQNPLTMNRGPGYGAPQLQLPVQDPLEVNHCQEMWHKDGFCQDIGCFTMWTYTVSNL